MHNSYFVGDLTNHSAIIDLEGSTLFLGHGHIIGQNLRFLKNSWLFSSLRKYNLDEALVELRWVVESTHQVSPIPNFLDLKNPKLSPLGSCMKLNGFLKHRSNFF